MDEESLLHQTVSLTSGCVVCPMFPYKTESHANKTLMLLGLIRDVRPLENTYLDDRAWKNNCVHVCCRLHLATSIQGPLYCPIDADV